MEQKREIPKYLEIAAKRMNTGDAVAEGFLYGIRAIELEAARLVPEATLRHYRSGWFFNLKQTYGEEVALKKEANAQRRHEQARSIVRV